MLAGSIAFSDGRLPEARIAFVNAAAATASPRAAEQALATVHLQLGETADALRILSRLSGMDPHNMPARRLLAQAYLAGDHPDAAVQELEEAHAEAADDLETTFALAAAYVRVKKLEAADRLFEEVAAHRRIPQTYLLIGRACRDAGAYDRAAAAFRRALAIDPRVPRAHYYLATVALMSEGIVRLDEAIREFQEERAISPDDPLTNLRLGMALVEAHREREALPLLDAAAHRPNPPIEAVEYLGRAQLAVGRADAAVTNLREALRANSAVPADAGRTGHLHYELGTALRKAGRSAEADAEFDEAQRASSARAMRERSGLAQYLSEGGAAVEAGAIAAPFEIPAISKMTVDERTALGLQLRTALARTALNLGVLQAQGDRFARAAAWFEQAAAIDPAFPRVQYSLGVAYFNAGNFAKAAVPLQRALEAEPQNVEARRMLAMASLNIGDYPRAVELLASDPQRAADPSLEYTYGLALIRSDRAAEAERIFAKLLAEHGDAPEINVLLGQAHAQQGDFDAAVAALEAAIAKKPDVAEANATLGIIYLKQGRLAESIQALRAELGAHPADVKTRYTLATALDLDGHQDEAQAELTSVLKTRPDYAEARYLQGKILLARGDAPGAVAQLEIAVRLAPDDANIHYQLGQAYQKLGKTDLAQEQFLAFQRLKDQRRKG
jgi:tetratricopeptide (TPR) repeat protein